MERRIKVNPLENVLRAALKEVEVINGQLDTLVVTYLRTFLDFREVLNNSYEIERKLSITNNDLILRWDTHVKGEEAANTGHIGVGAFLPNSGIAKTDGAGRADFAISI